MIAAPALPLFDNDGPAATGGLAGHAFFPAQYQPCGKTGFLFSRNAVTPSAKSAVLKAVA